MPLNLVTIAPELLLAISEYLPLTALQAFLRCNRQPYHLLLSQLYRRVGTIRSTCNGSYNNISWYGLLQPAYHTTLPWLSSARRVALSLAAGLDVNVIVHCQEHRTRLHQAVASWCASRDQQQKDEEEEVIQLLLAHGADVNARDHTGRTPLHLLSESEIVGPRGILADDMPISVLEMLLRSGADVNAVTLSGNTPLHRAVEYFPSGHKVARTLLEQGADPKRVNTRGRSALHYALTYASGTADGKYRVVELLLHYGADPNIVDREGITILIWALSADRKPEELNLLLDHGADPNKCDQTRQSPLQHALWTLKAKYNGCGLGPKKEKRVCEIIRLLVAKGALIEKLGEMDQTLVKKICNVATCEWSSASRNE